MKNFFGGGGGVGGQIAFQIRVFAIFSRLHQFSLILHKIAAWDNA